tara:strand:+ start:65 stop:460 length:396 start_codon:yes stop_codon:yes gene_type:complete
MYLLGKILLFVLGIWCVYTSISAFLGVTIFFPFNISPSQEIPYQRWQSVRVALLLTLAYFSFRHFLRGSQMFYPIQLWDVYVKALVISAGIIFWRADVASSEWLVFLFYAIVSVILHFASRPGYRKLFFRR